IATLEKAPSMLRALEFSTPRAKAIEFGRSRLRVTWDDLPNPSIDAPLALFYGAGTLYNREGKEYLVKGFPIYVRFDAERVYLACYFPMPFFRSAKIELTGPAGARPSSGAARSDGRLALDEPAAPNSSGIAAPGDGRTPEASEVPDI